MSRTDTYRRWLGVVMLFTLMAGDTWRNLLSWWGWGVIAVVLLVLAIVELVRARVDLRRVPLAVYAFFALITLSLLWSDYPGATALGVLGTLATATLAVYLATVIDLEAFLRAFGLALRWLLGLSLLFEFVVAAFIRHPVLPLWVDYSQLKKIPMAYYWSRDLLFHGGQIQGVQGNSNLLALAALFALVVFAVQWVAGTASKAWLGFWAVIALITLALTRSSTVLLALAAVVLVGAFLALVRRTWGTRRRIVYGGGAAAALGIAVVGFAARGSILDLLGKSSDLTHRSEIWNRVIELANERPAAGWGWVSYWAPWVEPFRHLAVFKGVTYLQAHDAWLDVYLQLGVIGLVVFGWLVLTTLGRSWLVAVDAGPRPARLVAVFPLLITVVLIVHSIAESRLLIEIGFTLLVVAAIRSAEREPAPDA
ncbi:O-antigen ligase family protein [Lysinimonas soli]|uniref:O-antigen ligase family protein n=1 Tax=Lysinimonas soli TaxID=1074233 RepID=A0ABW0NTH2_9MICO